MATTFTVTSTTQVAPAIIRLTFSEMPLAASAVGLNDATNPLNYSVAGPAEVRIEKVRPTNGDPFSVDLVGDQAFDIGTWQFTLGPIKTPTDLVLDLSILNLEITTIEKFFTPGARNISGEDMINQFLNPIFAGPGWKSLKAAHGYSDQKIQDLAKAAFFQNFLTTASDVYLEKLTTSISVDRAPNTGMSDDTLRELAIAVNVNKVVLHPYLQVLKAYYGKESVQANITAILNEPYALTDGDYLLLTVDDTELKVVFNAPDFSNIGQASALEVVQVLNRTFISKGLIAFAEVITDPTTNNKTVEVFSGRLGLYGNLLVRGGTAEDTILFPKVIETGAGLNTSWQIFTHTSHPTLVPYGKAWLWWTGSGANPVISKVFDGDYAVIHDPVFSADNRGDFLITSVGIYQGNKYVEFDNLDAVAEGPLLQLDESGVIFLNGSPTTINGSYFASAIQPWDEQVDVLLPATARAIDRTEKTGAYLNGESAVTIDPYEAFRTSDGAVQIAFPTNHGLVAGQYVQLQGFRPIYDRDPFIPLNNNTAITNNSFGMSCSCVLDDGRLFWRRPLDWAIYDPVADTWSAYSEVSTADRWAATCVKMNDGRVLIIGGSASYNTAEIYDPETNVITPTTSPSVFHAFQPQSGLLRDGKVFVTSGTTTNDAIEVYDPVTSTWSILTSTTTGAGAMQTAVVTQDGTIVVMGGWLSTPVDGICVMNGPSKRLYSLPAERYAGTSFFVKKGPKGQVWYMGGYDNTDTAVDTVYVFDLNTMTITNTYNLNYPRAFGQLVPLENGKFLLFGGTTQTWTLMPFSFSGGPPPEIIDPFALVDDLKFRDMGPELQLNYETTVAPQMTDDGRLIVPSPLNPIYHQIHIFQQIANGGMSGKFKVIEAPTPDTVIIETPQHKWRTNWLTGQVIPVDARRGQIASGYLINPKDGVTITGTTTILGQTIISGGSPASIVVSSVADIPDAPGYLVFSFGTQYQSKPIRYLGVTSNQIRLDPSEIFAFTYQAGTEITLLASKGVYSPESTLGFGVFYITASSAGRIAASDDIDSIAAVGLTVNKTILYPGDRGLGNQRRPAEGTDKISDKVAVWGGDSITTELEEAREGDGGA